MSKTTKIYGIKDNDTNEIVYVGKTKNDLEKRFLEHKHDIKHPDKSLYLQQNDCSIELLHECFYTYEVSEWEQYYITEFESPRKNWFNRIRAKALTPVEKHIMGKLMLKENHTIDGEFHWENNDTDLFN